MTDSLTPERRGGGTDSTILLMTLVEWMARGTTLLIASSEQTSG